MKKVLILALLVLSTTVATAQLEILPHPAPTPDTLHFAIEDCYIWSESQQNYDHVNTFRTRGVMYLRYDSNGEAHLVIHRNGEDLSYYVLTSFELTTDGALVFKGYGPKGEISALYGHCQDNVILVEGGFTNVFQ